MPIIWFCFVSKDSFALNNCAHSRCADLHGVKESPEQVLQQWPANEATEVGLLGSIHF